MTGALIVIPARYASSRYPGKPLVELRGADGTSRTLLERTWLAAGAVPGVDRVIVATDDARIADAARGFGAEAAMTPEACRNGTERCAAVLGGLDAAFDVVVNFQGDAPLTPPHFVSDLLDALGRDDGAGMATPVLRADAETAARLLGDRRAGRVGGTTAVFDARRRALYFSKEVLPFAGGAGAGEIWHHVGVYAYRAEVLRAYGGWPMGPLETAEGLEQLRFLEAGHPVLCVEVDARGAEFWELNNPGDVATIEAILAQRGL